MKHALIVLLLLMMVAGCARHNVSSRQSQNPNANQLSRAQNSNPTGDEVRDRQPQSNSYLTQSTSGLNDKADASRQQAAPDQTSCDHLERLATSIPQVKGANCVRIGNYAVVGIDVIPELDRSKVGSVKYSVAQALKKDPQGANAIVTADIDLGHRIKSLRDRVQSGQPIYGLTEEMSNIIGRIIPQVPRDTRGPAANSNQQQLLNDNL